MKYHTIAHAISSVPTLIGTDQNSLRSRQPARNAATSAGVKTIGMAIGRFFRHSRGTVKQLAKNPMMAPNTKPNGAMPSEMPPHPPMLNVAAAPLTAPPKLVQHATPSNLETSCESDMPEF